LQLLISLTLLAVVWGEQSFALNWEGHDGFFGEAMPLDDFVQGVPQPITRAKPDCLYMAEQHAQNAYEQVPVPGVNCIGKLPDNNNELDKPNNPKPGHSLE
jgi:hypothetical protein